MTIDHQLYQFFCGPPDCNIGSIPCVRCVKSRLKYNDLLRAIKTHGELRDCLLVVKILRRYPEILFFIGHK